MRPFRQRMAALHRRIEQRHRACAELHLSYADRLRRWADDNGSGRRPGFMTAVAEQLCMGSATITLFDDDLHELLVVCSDSTARAAYDLEAVVGSGPARDVAAGLDGMVVSGPALAARWPQYGSAVLGLGVQTLVAVALLADTRRIGALCAFSPDAGLGADLVTLADRIADALANVVLLAPVGPSTQVFDSALFDDADFLTEVHQAVGAVSVQRSCDPDTALVLLRVRAFAENVPLTRIARQVMDGTCRL